jgi:hypothetical protein
MLAATHPTRRRMPEKAWPNNTSEINNVHFISVQTVNGSGKTKKPTRKRKRLAPRAATVAAWERGGASGLCRDAHARLRRGRQPHAESVEWRESSQAWPRRTAA